MSLPARKLPDSPWEKRDWDKRFTPLSGDSSSLRTARGALNACMYPFTIRDQPLTDRVLQADHNLWTPSHDERGH
jgi:hypothetical protein